MNPPGTIVITSAGTLGDHLPYIALGQRLARRGHRVRMAVNSAMHAHVRAAGLQARDCGRALGEARARAGASDWDDLHPDPRSSSQWLQQMHAYFAQELPLCLADLLRACEGADLLVCGLQQQALAPLVSRRLDLPWVAASVMPAAHCTDQGWQLGRKSRLMPHIHRLAGEVLATLAGGRPVAPDHGRIGALLGASPQLCQPTAAHAHYEPTGFWFGPVGDPAAPAEAGLSPALQSFLQAHPAPLVLSFSSQPLLDAPGVLALHARAARQLGRGLVVQRGWAGFCEDMLPLGLRSQAVLFTDFIPQDALFAQAGAVLHHGGIGTLARALLHGCPMLVEPYGNDQFFNAQRVLALGVGAAAHPKKISPDALAQLLAQRVMTSECRARAQALGTLLRQEDGTGRAAERIEAWLADVPNGRRIDALPALA